MKAHEFLATALNAMEERAQLRDSEEGERSMAATVKAFNAIRKTSLTEEDGWAFMVLLKLVRSTNGKFHADDYVDGAAYFGLLGEAAEKERGMKKDNVWSSSKAYIDTFGTGIPNVYYTAKELYHYYDNWEKFFKRKPDSFERFERVLKQMSLPNKFEDGIGKWNVFIHSKVVEVKN